MEPYSVRLDADKALQLVKQGTSLLLLDVPPSLSFGFDLQIFVVGPNFRGMKMIPPGPHFVYYSVSSSEGSSAPVTGFFIFATQSQVIIRRWDAQEEVFKRLLDSDEEGRYASGVRNLDFDRNLAPYDVHHFKRWQELSEFITAAVIARFEPAGGDITVIAEAELVEQHPKKIVETEKGRCRYTDLPRLVKRAGVNAKDLTSLNMDKSEILQMALKENYEEREELLLGELQFSYIAFLMGQSLESFQQWMSIVSLMLSCQEAPLRTFTQLFVKFLKVLYHQMKQGLKTADSVPLLDDSSWFTADNFFRLLFKEFVLMLKNTQPVDGELLFQASRLKQLLETCLGWDFESEANLVDEDDEYAPVIVTDV